MTDWMLFLPLGAEAVTSVATEIPSWVERLGLPVVLLLIVLAVQYFKDRHNQKLEDMRQKTVEKERAEWRDDMRQREKDLVERVRMLETQLGSFREETLLRATLAMEKMQEAVQVMKAERLSTLQCLQAMGCQAIHHPAFQPFAHQDKHSRGERKQQEHMETAGARASDKE